MFELTYAVLEESAVSELTYVVQMISELTYPGERVSESTYAGPCISGLTSENGMGRARSRSSKNPASFDFCGE